MATEIISPNMSLPIPVTGVTPGPDYADDIISCLTLIDEHDHTGGRGAPISASGININSDLLINNQNLILVRSIRFYPQTSPLTASVPDLGCLYEAGSDLYYNDGDGNQIRLTASGSIAGTPGSIANLVSPASASYVAGSLTFVWESDVNTAANMDMGSLILRNGTAGSNALTLAPPNSIGSNYQITLPTLPASQKILALDALGNMTAAYMVDNSSLQISSNLLSIKPLGITGGMIANGTIPAAKLTPSSVTASQIFPGTLTGTQMSSNINFPGKSVQEQGLNVVVSNTNNSQSLSIIRATFNSSGTLIAGEGASSSAPSGSPATQYTVTFSTPFLDTPVIQLTSINNFPPTLYLTGVSNTGCSLVSTGQAFCVTAIGQRA